MRLKIGISVRVVLCNVMGCISLCFFLLFTEGRLISPSIKEIHTSRHDIGKTFNYTLLEKYVSKPAAHEKRI